MVLLFEAAALVLAGGDVMMMMRCLLMLLAYLVRYMLSYPDLLSCGRSAVVMHVEFAK